MTKATYKTMPDLLKSFSSFILPNSRLGATVTATRSNGSKYDIYTVYSYSTVIYERKIDKQEGKVSEYFNNSKYSPTTSKLQNMLIDIFNLNGGNHNRE